MRSTARWPSTRSRRSLATKIRPDFVMLVIPMSRPNGLDAARQLNAAAMPEVRMIFLTVSEDPDLAAEALRAGTSG